MPSRHIRFRKTVRALAAAASLAGLLAACGGGGGDDGAGPPGGVDITLGNRDALARAASVAMSGGLSTSLDKALSLGSVSRSSALAWKPSISDCALGGSVQRTANDDNGDGRFTPGDTLDVQFIDCIDADGSLTAGRIVLTLRGNDSSSMRMDMALQQLAISNAGTGRALQVDGTMSMTYTEPDATQHGLRLQAAGEVTLRVGHPLYSDTVTLRDGFVVTLQHDETASLTRETVQGDISAASVGGNVRLSSSDLVQRDADAYPQAGVLELLGRNGSLQLQVLSAQQVHLRTDTDGNGSADDERDVDWATLL